MVKYKVPFFGNTKDGIHCYQASIKMLAKYFWPERNYSWKELEKITGMEPGLWTWSVMGIKWLYDQGLDVIFIDPFNYGKFIEEGGDYLINQFGEEVGEAQIKNSNIDKERVTAKKLLGKLPIEKRIPTIQDVKQYLDEGYLLRVNVNSKALKGKKGYTGHSIIVIGYDENNIFVHDPGLPPREDLPVSWETFEKAWAYPDDLAKDLLALKKRR